MPAENNSAEIQAALVQTVRRAHPETQAIYLYGSWGTEYRRPESDLDLGLLLPFAQAKFHARPEKLMEWYELAQGLGALAGAPSADLCNLRLADTQLQMEVMRPERVLYCADERERVRFEATVMGMYQQLNYEREAIRRDIVAECRAVAAAAKEAQT